MGPDSVKSLYAIKSVIVSMYENQILNLVDSSEGVKTTEHSWSYQTKKCRCLNLQDSQIFEKIDWIVLATTTYFSFEIW
jgi:hypothetical protein